MTDAEQTGMSAHTSAKMLKLAGKLEARLRLGTRNSLIGIKSGSGFYDEISEAVAALRTAAGQDARPGADAVALAAGRENLREAWAALAMIREVVETLGPVGAVKASEHLDGPTFMHEADALVAGIVALRAKPSPGVPTGFDAGGKAVVEQCAKIAEAWISDFGATPTKYLAVKDIADAIRALAAPQPQAPISECCREDSLIDRPCSAFEDQQREINKLENEIAALCAQPQAGASEPVAWRTHHEDDPEGYWSYHEYPIAVTEREQQQALYATPSPTAAGRK